MTSTEPTAPAEDPSRPPDGPSVALLSGLRVLELGNFIAAPTAGRLLADFGAEVIKVERPGTGDELRRWRLHAGETSLLFHTINRNKKSIELDLRTPGGQEAIRRLVEKCDVVVENFRPGTLERWGLGPDDLDRINPDIVIVRISAFGQTGPKAAQPGFAAVAEAVGGLRELVGEPDRPPMRVGVSIGDSIAGLYGAFGAVMALLHARQRSTRLDERTIDVALNEAVLSVLESLIPDHMAHGITRQRLGGRVEGIAPSNAYTCKDDKSVVIAGNADGIFNRLMTLIGRNDLLDDPELSTNDGRWDRRDELDDAIGEWTATLGRDDVLAELERVGVPVGPINTAADIVDDVQFRARNMIQVLSVDTGGETASDVGFPGIVPVIGETSPPIRSVGPALGEHTTQILGELLELERSAVESLLTES